MRRQDPYAAPGVAVGDPADSANTIHWKRIVGWGVLICTATTSIYILGGMIVGRPRFHGIAMDDIAVSIVSFALYLVFLHATLRRHFLQLMCVFLAMQAFGIAVSGAIDLLLVVMTDDSFGDLISFVELGWDLLTCLLAYAAWYATTRKWRALEDQ